MKRFLLVFCAFLFLTEISAQINTMLTVRTRAKDAKFIGSSMGGSYITVRNAQSDELLAEGYTEGSTGNTSRIMKIGRAHV
jgi:predicted alpha/beta hydrolase